MTKYLVHKVETDSVGCYAIEIRQTVSWLIKEHGDQTATKKVEYTKALCTAAATISGSNRLSRLMAGEYGSQSIRSSNDISPCILTALAYLGDISRLKPLIDAGVDVNAEGLTMGKPLQAAAAKGHIEIVSLLLKSGADANSGDSKYDDTPLQLFGNTPLQLACSAGHEGIVRILLSPEYDIRRLGSLYQKAVMSAVRGDNVDLMQLLIRFYKGKYILQDKMLQNAAAHGAVNVLRILLDEGADINSQDSEFRTPLQTAASRGYVEIVQLLLARGADYHMVPVAVSQFIMLQNTDTSELYRFCSMRAIMCTAENMAALYMPL